MDLSNLKDNVIIIEDFIPQNECINLLQRVPVPYKLDSSGLPWEHRTISFKNHPSKDYVEKYWNDYFNVNHLKVLDAELTLWPIQSQSTRHIHEEPDRAHGTYNSILYLNDNYLGGEFFTDKITIKPKAGTITFFNGRKTYHGLNPVYWQNRYCLIFWFN